MKLGSSVGSWRATPFTAAIGLRWQLVPGRDRGLLELHEYERLRNAYAVFSAQPSSDVYLHGLFRHVVYDIDGNRTPTGRTALFPGFSVPSSWNQFGLGAEWYFAPRWSAFSEGTIERDVEFAGGMRRHAINAGARYQEARWGAGVWAKRIEHPEFRNLGLQAAVNF